MLLSVNNLDIRFGDKHLFKNVSFQVYEGNKIGLVGVNGAGKSTLLKLMAGITGTDDGVISRSKHVSVAYLPQEPDSLTSNNSLYDEARSAFSELIGLEEEARQLHAELAGLEPQSRQFEKIMDRLAEIDHSLGDGELYTIQAKIEKILFGLGFKADDLHRPAASFSGGWIMRLMLAKILLTEPLLLLLDEPTNHLDLDSLTWLEKFLAGYDGAMVIISHDRAFLDKITNQTVELSLGNLSSYKGNYSFFVKEKAERRAVEKAAYDNQQTKIRQTMRFVERFRAKSTKAKQVQSRVKQLEKMELIELAEDEQHIKFRFPPAPDSGRDVLAVDDLHKSFDGKTVFDHGSFQLQRGDKVAVVGVNGAGKSTLLKILSGQLEKDQGQVKLGTNVILSYFGQHQAQELAGQLTALETLQFSSEGLTITQVRSLLGAFLFRGEEVDKKVAVLSGGEKSRLALAKMIAMPANLMLLDEPTNHLDMSSQEVLQEAMAQYDGTIIVVSHNRYFVDSFINKVLEVRDGRLTMYEGNVAEYLRKMEAKQQQLQTRNKATDQQPQQKKSSSKENRKEQRKREAERRQERSRRIGSLQKEVEEAEAKAEALELTKAELEALMADPELYKDETAWAQTSKEYEDCKRRLERWYSRWEAAQQKIDEIDAELAGA